MTAKRQMAGGHGGPRVVTGALHRVRRGRGKAFAAEAPAADPPAAPAVGDAAAAAAARPARVAITLALAHKIQEAIDRGEVRDRAEVARRLGLTRARVTQLLELTMLAPEIQEEILGASRATSGDAAVLSRHVRRLVRSVAWSEQRAGWQQA